MVARNGRCVGGGHSKVKRQPKAEADLPKEMRSGMGAQTPQQLHACPREPVVLDHALCCKESRIGGGRGPGARGEREEAVEQRLGLGAKERFVMGASDANVEAPHPARGT